MPENTINQAFVEQYTSNLTMLSQRMNSIYEPYVVKETGTGTRYAFEYLAPTSVQEVVERHGDSPHINMQHSRRWCIFKEYHWGTLLEKLDEVKMLISPQSPYVQNAVAAFKRLRDQVIFNKAIFGTTYTGAEGDTAEAWLPDEWDGTNLGDHNQQLRLALDVETEGPGLTLAKLRTLKLIFDSRDLLQDEERIIACSPAQIVDLLSEEEIVSSDYANVKALVDGKVDSFMGFRFVPSTAVPKDGTTRRCVAWVKSGVGIVEPIAPSVKMSERADKRYNTYIYIDNSMGGVRLQNDKIVEVPCTES